jgi:phenylacetate-CoA ligase
MQADEYFDPEIETMSQEQVRALQEAKLRKQLAYLFERSPFYQDKFRAAGIRREHFQSLPDIARFPFTTKDKLRESQMACPPLGRHMACDLVSVIRIHSSTGTTGRPSLVGLTRRDALSSTARPSQADSSLRPAPFGTGLRSERPCALWIYAPDS